MCLIQLAIMASGGMYALKTIDKSVARTQRSRNRNGNPSNSSQNTLDHQRGPPRYYDQNRNYDQGYWGPPPGPPPVRGGYGGGGGGEVYVDVDSYTQGRGFEGRTGYGYGYGGDGVYAQLPGYSYVQGPPSRPSSRSKKGKTRSVAGERRNLARTESRSGVGYTDGNKAGRYTETELRNRTRRV
ncbi:hypothetical protein DL95DRAFT_409455 [Leptodontidium sp. 2 PMI_412]|nr:hypothetical protein DL95DRAFT_409455 [Leptodontidium sp. 2 PMI_412]